MDMVMDEIKKTVQNRFQYCPHKSQKNEIPYHIECVSYPKNHFKVIQNFTRKNRKLTKPAKKVKYQTISRFFFKGSLKRII